MAKTDLSPLPEQTAPQSSFPISANGNSTFAVAQAKTLRL